MVSSGLSTAAARPTPRNAPSYSLAQQTASRGNPTQRIGVSRVNNGMAGIRLPHETPPYFMRIGIHTYSRQNWLDIGDLAPGDSIIVPLPNMILDSQTVNWEAQELGMAAHAIGAISGVANGNGPSLATVGSVTAGAAARFGMGIAKEAAGAFGAAGTNAVLAKAGMAVNDFLVMMLKGPTFKTHNFTWKFSPNTVEESTTLASIYSIIMDAQAPGLANNFGSAFFTYPKIFQLEFVHPQANLGTNLFRFKKSVLTSAKWNFTPMNMPAFYTSKAPESVIMDLTFTELEYWLTGDYSAGGYGGGQRNFSLPFTLNDGSS